MNTICVYLIVGFVFIFGITIGVGLDIGKYQAKCKPWFPISAEAEIESSEVPLSNYNNFEDDQEVIIVGMPGAAGLMVQPGQILTDVGKHDEDNFGAKLVTAQYIDVGISGGCVYSSDGERLLGIVTTKFNSGSMGIVTPVNRVLK
jgi:hypothetical protein